MAEITQAESSGYRPARRTRRSPVRIDMTPMVDLAFLLLTFFVLTTSLNKAYILDVTMPVKTSDPTPMSEKRVITLLLGKENHVYWYAGLTPAINETDFHRLRKFLISKKAAIPDLVVLVKASDKAHYQNIVDVIDEFAITGIGTYFIVEMTNEDHALLASRESP